MDNMNFLPRVTKCCCCFSLRTGTLIIGYISVIGSAISLAATSFFLYKVISFMAANGDKPNPEHTPEEIASMALSLYITLAYMLLVLLYYFIISLLLIIGVHLSRTNYMRYFFYTALFLLVLDLALVVVTCVFLGFLATVPILKWCIILFYSLIVVRSAYLEMEEQNKPRVYEMQSLYSPQRAPLMA